VVSLSLILTNANFVVVPAHQEKIFTLNVINNYMDCTKFKKEGIASDMDICGEMVDTLNSIASVEIFEDRLAYTRLKEADPMMDLFGTLVDDQFDGFMYDIVLALENCKMSYQLEYDGSYHNLPGVGVW
jgi:hypothetical protein